MLAVCILPGAPEAPSPHLGLCMLRTGWRHAGGGFVVNPEFGTKHLKRKALSCMRL
jgi:hypothetical protein